VDYRLAPEHRFPHGLEDAFAALVHVAHHPEWFGVDPERLGVAGDSAGGTFAAAICQRALARGPRIAFQLLICPILDVLGETAARRDLARGYFLDRETMARDLELYVPRGADLSDPRLSPLRARSVARLPTAYIHTAQFDPFSEEAETYAARLVKAGVPVHGVCHPGMIHFFYAMPRMIPYALTAARIIGAEIRHAVQLPMLPERRTQIRTRPELIRA
jgi:acetyl esterase/lipase